MTDHDDRRGSSGIEANGSDERVTKRLDLDAPTKLIVPPAPKVEEQPTLPEPAPNAPARQPQAGDRLANRYVIVRRLGSGGMGDVYLARDELGDRQVALKLLRRHVASNLVIVNRFRREARITAQLSSPNAVKVYDFGQTDDGSLYLTMEYLEGETLGEMLSREEHLAPTRVIEIVLELLSVLGEAHGYGIIHRDIKPANIYLAKGPAADSPIVKLLDFGIAKLRATDATELTSSGDVWGTPRYMSPEQARGKVIDPRSDLYSLGVLMYRALTGVFPHDATNAAELAFALLNDVTVPPDKRRPELGIPPELGKVVMRALAKDAELRYPSATAMAADLRAVAVPQEGRQEKPQDRVRWFVRSMAFIPIILTFLSMLEVPLVLRSPFPGFAVESGLLVSAIMDSTWPAAAADVQPYDILREVNGVPVRSGDELRARLSSFEVGTPVEYTLERDERSYRVRIPLSRMTPFVLFKQYGSGLLSGLFFCLVGAVVAWRRPFSRDTHALLVFTGAMGTLLSSNLDLDQGYLFPFVWRLAMSTVGAAMAHLGLTYPVRWLPLHKKPGRLIALYAPALALFGVWQSSVREPKIAFLGMRVAAFYFVVGGIVLLGRLFHARFRGATLAVRQSARALLWGVGVSIGPSIGLTVPLMLSSTWFSSLTWFSMSMLAIFPSVVAHQIVRGEIFDVDLAISAVARAICKQLLFFVAFTLPALGIAAVCRLLETGLGPQLILGISAGLVVVTIAAEWLDRVLQRIFDRNSDAASAAALDQFAAATQNAESKIDVIDILCDTLQQNFSPNTLHIFERGPSDQYWDILADSQVQIKTRLPKSLTEIAPSAMEIPKSGDSIVKIRESLTLLGHWDAHAYLVLPFVGAQTQAESTAALDSVLVVGTRADGRPYSSFHVTLTAGLIRIAVLRIQAIEDRVLQKKQILEDRCLGPERKSRTTADSDMLLDAPARGLAATLVVRLSGLDLASECLSPRQFKKLMDELYDTAAMISLHKGGTLHSIRGDELLFGFGALGLERVSAELEAIAAALDQVRRLRTIIQKHKASGVRVRCGLSRGVVTVGVFGASFRQDCLLIGAAIGEATTLVDQAHDDEVVVDEDIAKLVEIVKAPYSIEQRSGPLGMTRVIRHVST